MPQLFRLLLSLASLQLKSIQNAPDDDQYPPQPVKGARNDEKADQPRQLTRMGQIGPSTSVGARLLTGSRIQRAYFAAASYASQSCIQLGAMVSVAL